MEINERIEAGQAVYTPMTLKIYDHVVLGFSNSYLWRCPTIELQAMYDRNVRNHHLDIGVGSGYFLDKADWGGAAPKITLLDLNANSLKAAAERIQRYSPVSIQADIFKPLPIEETFQSVGLNYLLHCLPGAMSEKAPIVFDHVLQVTEPGAHIFGATLLQDNEELSAPSRALMSFYNGKGIFSNRDDTLKALEEVLKERFKTYQVQRHGAGVLFEAVKDH